MVTIRCASPCCRERWGAAVSRLHPVEQVSWIDCTEWLPKAGLTLPSEAQWEYGARGGSENPWWTGPVQESLAGAANLSDKWAGEHGGQEWLSLELWLNDGATVHAGAGNYASNAYGLHDVVGNVWEWCKDGFDLGFYARSARLDPECPWMGTSTRVVRGGSFQIAAAQARSACRNSVSPNSAEGALGVRPARSIDP